MKIAFAILCDNYVHNLARRLSLEINEKYGTGLIGALLPPHVSLKQPFSVDGLKGLEKVEKYFDQLAKSVSPFNLEFTKISIFEGDVPVIYADLKQDEKLMKLHLKILEDLKKKFNIDKDRFEGKETYHFHCTLAVAGKELDTYKKIFDEYRDFDVKYSFKFSELAMFIYTDDSFKIGSFFMYKKIKLS